MMAGTGTTHTYETRKEIVCLVDFTIYLFSCFLPFVRLVLKEKFLRTIFTILNVTYLYFTVHLCSVTLSTTHSIIQRCFFLGVNKINFCLSLCLNSVNSINKLHLCDFIPGILYINVWKVKGLFFKKCTRPNTSAHTVQQQSGSQLQSHYTFVPFLSCEIIYHLLFYHRRNMNFVKPVHIHGHVCSSLCTCLDLRNAKFLFTYNQQIYLNFSARNITRLTYKNTCSVALKTLYFIVNSV